jgi:hypothetical protein
MIQNPAAQGLPPQNSPRSVPATREMVHARARELALLAGHPAPHVAQANYEQAKRDLAGGQAAQDGPDSARA